MAELRLARALELEEDEVRFAADHIRESSSTFVFAVRDVDELKQELEEAVGEMEAALREAEQGTRVAEHGLRQAEARTREAEAAAVLAERALRRAADAGRAAENAPAENRERMAKEIGEVEALVASFIAFARDDPAEEARARLDLAALLQSIADDRAEAGRSVVYEGEERVIVTGQSLGLKRLFNNLVDNALKYGTRARIALRREGALVLVDIADDGPGVPAEQRESVFEPFVRLDNGEARSGAGLGLPAARWRA